MAESRNEKKIIKLKELQPNNYRLWAAQSESTFEVHGVLDIVLGREPHPSAAQATTPPEDADAPVLLTPAQRRSAVMWEQKNAIARQALLACLQPAELTKVYSAKSAHDIWQRLADEYGAISNLRLAHAESAFYSFRKDPQTPMQDHINKFAALQQDVDYQRGISMPHLSDIQINLAFLNSLGYEWKGLHTSMGGRINSIKPATLYSEILALQKPPTDESPPPLDALTARAPWSKKPYKPATAKFNFQYKFDRSKYCSYCKRNGHEIRECLKKKWKDNQDREETEEESKRSNDQSYLPRWQGN